MDRARGAIRSEFERCSGEYQAALAVTRDQAAARLASRRRVPVPGPACSPTAHASPSSFSSSSLSPSGLIDAFLSNPFPAQSETMSGKPTVAMSGKSSTGNFAYASAGKARSRGLDRGEPAPQDSPSGGGGGGGGSAAYR